MSILLKRITIELVYISCENTNRTKTYLESYFQFSHGWPKIQYYIISDTHVEL